MELVKKRYGYDDGAISVWLFDATALISEPKL